MNPRDVRVALMATPEFGVPTLRALVDAGYQVVGVICQPDKPAGRGMQVTPPPVKRAAQALSLPVLQFANLRSHETIAAVTALRSDLILVAAFGQWIPDEIIALPARGCLNLHPSLLPRHRGASPVAAAILAGDAVTGVSILFVTSEMDAGDLLAQESMAVGDTETTGTLTARLAELGAAVYVRTIQRWLDGAIVPWKQDASQSTWCDRITKEQGRLDWRRPAIELARQVRAYDPWPGAFTQWQGVQLNVLSVSPRPDWDGTEAPGTVIRLGRSLAVATGRGALELGVLQLANKRPQDAAAFANGARTFVGSTLGTPALASGIGRTLGNSG